MKLLKNNSGVIMMETLITLPVYLLILAGLFWLGEGSLVRLTLIDGENYTLWAKGNRHESDDVSRSQLFWFLDPDGDITAQAAVKSENFSMSKAAFGWGEINTGSLTGKIKRSNWSWGVSDSIKDLQPEPAETPGKSYSDSSAQGGNVMILSRRDDDTRTGDGSYNGKVLWYDIALGSWGSFIRPTSSGNAAAISEYKRNESYEDWSD